MTPTPFFLCVSISHRPCSSICCYVCSYFTLFSTWLAACVSVPSGEDPSHTSSSCLSRSIAQVFDHQQGVVNNWTASNTATKVAPMLEYHLTYRKSGNHHFEQEQAVSLTVCFSSNITTKSAGSAAQPHYIYTGETIKRPLNGRDWILQVSWRSFALVDEQSRPKINQNTSRQVDNRLLIHSSNLNGFYCHIKTIKLHVSDIQAACKYHKVIVNHNTRLTASIYVDYLLAKT